MFPMKKLTLILVVVLSCSSCACMKKEAFNKSPQISSIYEIKANRQKAKKAVSVMLVLFVVLCSTKP